MPDIFSIIIIIMNTDRKTKGSLQTIILPILYFFRPTCEFVVVLLYMRRIKCCDCDSDSEQILDSCYNYVIICFPSDEYED